MKNEINELIEIKQDENEEYSVYNMVGVCKRVNNSKRDFLFVNKYQGKHYPQSPKKILNLFNKLIENIEEKNEKILVISFAETATAIGNYVAAKLKNCIYEMQTTREKIDKAESIIQFQEEHSHATDQLLYGDKKVFFEVSRIIFVEDEITTGKTIINFINEIKKINPNLKYAVASLLNWQDENATKIYEELNIDVYYLIRGHIKNVNAKIDVNTLNEINIEEKSNKKIEVLNINNNLCNFSKNRLGKKPEKDITMYSEDIFLKIQNSSNIANEITKQKNKDVLIIGTEEFMYEPLLFANYLEEHTQNNIFFQATTRSPIEVSNDLGYILDSRFKFNSCYDDTRTTYLYNLRKYDYVLIITDSILNNSFIEKMSTIAKKFECDFEKIQIIKLTNNNY